MPFSEKSIPPMVAQSNSLTDTIFAMYSRDIDKAARDMLSSPDRALSCTSLIGGLVGPRPPKHRSAEELYAQQFSNLVHAKLQRSHDGAQPSSEAVQHVLESDFKALGADAKAALREASAKEAFLRARECVLWEAEAAEAANIMHLCVQMRATALVGNSGRRKNQKE
jgi:uncharacterized membrane protein YsdA (DUF1294 family)